MSDKETCPEAIDEQALAAAAQNVYGPDTNLHEIGRRLSEYLLELTRLQTRWEEERLCPSFEEAVALVKRYQWPNPEHPEALAVAALISHCMVEVDGREMLIEDRIRELLEVWQDEKESKWDRFWTQEALETIAAQAQKDHPLTVEIVQRLASGHLNRPIGRCDPRTDEVRNTSIVTVIGHLQSLGMKPARNEVSSLHSACDAVAKARGLTYTTVETVWKRRKGTQANRHRARKQQDGT